MSWDSENRHRDVRDGWVGLGYVGMSEILPQLILPDGNEIPKTFLCKASQSWMMKWMPAILSHKALQ